jgi:Leucine-rich repeat (LRR) protein
MLKLTKRGFTSLEGIEDLLRDATAVDLTQNPLRDLKGIAKAKKLVKLFADVEDPSALAGHSTLRFLIVKSPVRDMRWAKLPKLTTLGVIAPLTSLAGFDQLKAIEDVTLREAQLVKPISIVNKNLGRLVIRECRLKQMPELATPELHSLFLEDNDLTSTSGLSKVQRLNYVELSGNKIASLAALENLPALKFLGLDGRFVKTITAASDAHLRSLGEALRLRITRKAYVRYAELAAQKRIV